VIISLNRKDNVASYSKKLASLWTIEKILNSVQKRKISNWLSNGGNLVTKHGHTPLNLWPHFCWSKLSMAGNDGIRIRIQCFLLPYILLGMRIAAQDSPNSSNIQSRKARYVWNMRKICLLEVFQGANTRWNNWWTIRRLLL